MRRYSILALAAMVMGVCGAAQAADTEKAMADVAAKAKNSLAIMMLTVKEPGKDGKDLGVVPGQALCISSDGTFVTTALDPSLRKESVKSIQLILPGKDAKTIKAKFLGVDPATGLGFVRADEKVDPPLTPVEFAPEAKLVPGQMVISMGILAGDANHSTYLGVAYVSAVLRVPGPIVYVTGGKLTNICSPVFNTEGKAVGLVMSQPPLSYATDTPNGTLNLPLRGQEETSFFIPSDEFFQAVRKENIPKEDDIRRLPWLGINKFEPVTEQNAQSLHIEDLMPAVLVSDVIPNDAAEKAGIKNGDIILEVEGQRFEKMANTSFVVQNFMRQVMKFQIGQTIKLKVKSGSEAPREVKLVVAPMPNLPSEANRVVDQSLGMMLREKVPLDQHLSKDVAKVDGLIVVGVGDKSPAQLKGIAGNDLITAVNDTPVKTRDEYVKALDDAKAKGTTLKLTMYKAGSVQPTSVIFQIQPAPSPTPSK